MLFHTKSRIKYYNKTKARRKEKEVQSRVQADLRAEQERQNRAQAANTRVEQAIQPPAPDH